MSGEPRRSTIELEEALEQARERVAEAEAALARRHVGGEWEAWEAAHGARLAAERALALAQGAETALPCPWPVPWDKGAPSPHVVAAGGRVALLYLAAEPDPAWDGTSVAVIDPASDAVLPIALVEFIGCYGIRFGGPNDEVSASHPLVGRGLDSYAAHLVANSRWLAAE